MLDLVRNFSLSLPGTWEDMPFDENVLVFKVGSKMFNLLRLNEDPLKLSVKCEPTVAIELREQFPMHVAPAFHMNKKHWNTVTLSPGLQWELVTEWIRESYRLVFQNLTKKEQIEINGNASE